MLRRLRLSLNSRKTRIVHFDQGFRFLGVQFIRSLAFKTEADEPDLLGVLPVDGEIAAPASTAQAVSQPLSIMRLAFSEANLQSKDFPVQEVPLEILERPDEDGLPAGHELLLRTLYLLQHGQVLGKESERLIVRQGQVSRKAPCSP
ncbi:MAG: hypothetical protein PHO08_13480 [Methylococcales bacterium]|nr:hypothetical protein [Methylococcales bacterium]MDD5630924.1 hypothetical protein [Methylococcales bacterium]